MNRKYSAQHKKHGDLEHSVLMAGGWISFFFYLLHVVVVVVVAVVDDIHKIAYNDDDDDDGSSGKGLVICHKMLTQRESYVCMYEGIICGMSIY